MQDYKHNSFDASMNTCIPKFLIEKKSLSYKRKIIETLRFFFMAYE